MIESYASEEAIMVLRGTCHRLMQLFPDPTALLENASKIEAWRKRYTFNRREFKLQELVRREKEGDLPNNELVCWLCECTHPFSYFFPQHRVLEPEGRSCLGWNVKLKLCHHRCIMFKDVSGKQWTPGAWCGKLHSDYQSYLDQYLSPSTILARSPFEGHYPYHKACWCSGSRLPGDGGGRGIRLGVVGHGVDEEGRPSEWTRTLNSYIHGAAKVDETNMAREVVIRAEFVVMRLTEMEIVDKLKLLEVVDRLTETGMCSHLNLDVVSDLLLENPYVDCPTLERHGMETEPCPRPTSSFFSDFNTVFGNRKVKSKHNCGRKYYCPNKECGTYFYLYRARYTNFDDGWKDELVLCVVRNLGKCRDALDKRWLVQTERQDCITKAFVEKKFDSV